jgi:hypothetical protein
VACRSSDNPRRTVPDGVPPGAANVGFSMFLLSKAVRPACAVSFGEWIFDNRAIMRIRVFDRKKRQHTQLSPRACCSQKKGSTHTAGASQRVAGLPQAVTGAGSSRPPHACVPHEGDRSSPLANAPMSAQHTARGHGGPAGHSVAGAEGGTHGSRLGQRRVAANDVWGAATRASGSACGAREADQSRETWRPSTGPQMSVGWFAPIGSWFAQVFPF